jgi:Ca2+-binding RTX toxin-like protein
MGRWRPATLALAISALLAPPDSAVAARIEVDLGRDSFRPADGRCSLREAVESVNRVSDFGGCRGRGDYGDYDVVVLAGRVHRLTLPSTSESEAPQESDNSGGDLDLVGGDQVVLASFGARDAVVDAAGLDRALQVSNYDAFVLVQSVTIRGGRARGDGGGVLTYGDVAFLMSSIVGNSSAGSGGAIAAVGPRADVTLLNATVSGSVAGGAGGGVAAIGEADTTLDIYSATISRNRARRGGGIHVMGGTARLENSIVALNRGGDGGLSDCDGEGAGLFSFGGNLVSSRCPALRLRPRDLLSRRPGIEPLARNGGPVPTHGLVRSSPAVDAAKQGLCYRFDGRGAPRRLGGRCDIGAYERVTCGGVLVNLIGSKHSDRLLGRGGDDGILGLGGGDFLAGGDGDDALCGGRGDDLLSGGAGHDRLHGQQGDDRCRGGESHLACEQSRLRTPGTPLGR